MRLDLTIAQIGAVKAMLADDADDEQLLLDTIEGETDALEITKRLLDGIEAEEGDRAALTEQMEVRKVRRDRCDRRIKVRRDAIAAIMQCAGLDKMPLPEATVSLRMTTPKLTVNNPDAVPHEYAVQAWKPSMEAIKAAFTPDADNLPNWLRVEESRPSLTIRRK